MAETDDTSWNVDEILGNEHRCPHKHLEVKTLVPARGEEFNPCWIDVVGAAYCQHMVKKGFSTVTYI